MTIQADIVDRLRGVIDPCSLGLGAPTDIWSLGLVEDVTVTDGIAQVRLVLTDPSCVFFRGIRDHIAAALNGVPGIEAVEVALDATILWTPDRMKESA